MCKKPGQFIFFLILLLAYAAVSSMVSGAAVVTPEKSPAKTASPGASPLKNTTSPAGKITSSPTMSPAPSPIVTVQNDGMTLVQAQLSKEEASSPVHYLTLVAAVGYAHDPAGKSGLTSLTNQLFGRMLGELPVQSVKSETCADYSLFQIMVSHGDFETCCRLLQETLKRDKLPFEAACRELVLDAQNEPVNREMAARLNVLGLLNGEQHPIYVNRKSTDKNLNINDVNDWFMRYYRAEWLTLGTTYPLPVSWRQPAGQKKTNVARPAKLPERRPLEPEHRYDIFPGRLVGVCMGFPAPSPEEESHYAMMLLAEYLEFDLKRRLEFTTGLYGEFQVEYSWREQPTAPHCLISFRTTPENFPMAVTQVKEIMSQASGAGLTSDRLYALKETAKARLLMVNRSQCDLISAYTQAALFRSWPGPFPEYLSALMKVTSSQIQKLVDEKLKQIKVVAFGPIVE